MNPMTEAMNDLARRLTDGAVPTRAAWPSSVRPALTEPGAWLRLKKLETAPAGFQDYLGQVWDETTGRWAERYGRKVAATLCLDLYSPRQTGPDGCRDLLDKAAGVLLAGDAGPLRTESWQAGEAVFDREEGVFRQTVTLVCRGVFVGRTDESGSFLGFEVKGRMEG